MIQQTPYVPPSILRTHVLADSGTATVDGVAQEFLRQAEDTTLSHDLMGGTQAMIRAGRRYVEQGSHESQENYDARLRRAVLLNCYKRTLYFLRGQVFQKPVQLGSDADQRFLDWAENVDHSGKSLTTWSSECFTRGLIDGVVFCLVDHSRVPVRTRDDGTPEYQRADGTWSVKTVAADRENNWAPYLVMVKAEDVLDCWWKQEAGRFIVTHFRYYEEEYRPDANIQWRRRAVRRIRVYRPGEYEVWEQDTGEASSFSLVESGPMSVPHVPVEIFMPGDKRTPVTAEPALQDLAELNRRHWCATVGHSELMEYVRRPVWFGRGMGVDMSPGKSEPEPIVVGCGKAILMSNTDCDLRCIGVDPGSVAASKQELDDLKDAMAMYGLQLLQPKTGAVTATESLRDSQENNSTLEEWALRFQDFLENCLADVAKWWGLEDGPSVAVNMQFVRSAPLEFLRVLHADGVISRETLLEEVKKGGALPDDFDVAKESDRLARQAMTNAGPTGDSLLSSLFSGTGAGQGEGVKQ
ncbi:MAG: DUF4055 domain-containing protein [Desulfovibrio sp.]|nr:DUF4055 domain-containing protein [Desulfovibrio sp.]